MWKTQGKDHCEKTVQGKILDEAIPPGKDRWLATPMYWLIMAPHKAPPFGSGDRHLLLLLCKWTYYRYGKPSTKSASQISASVLSGFGGPLWLKISVDFNCKTPLHIRREICSYQKQRTKGFFLGVLKKSFRFHVWFRKGGLYMIHIYINIIINIMLKSHGFVPWFLVSADWWCLNIQFPSADWWDCQADSIPQQNDPSLSDWFRKFRYMGVSKNRGTPKCMVKIMEDPIKIDDLGVPLFSETSR